MKIISLFCLCLSLQACAPKEEAVTKPVVDVKIARVEQRDMQRLVRAPATIHPREVASIASRITAPIQKLHARKGDSVEAGQILVTLVSKDLQAQRAEAVAAVADAQATMEKLSHASLEVDLERARGQSDAAQAALDQAQKIFDRRRDLFQKGAIPNRDLLVSQTDLAAARANYDLAKKSLEILQTQSRERDIRIAESRVEQAKARLALVDAQLGFTELKSPFGGTITEQFQYPGDMARPDTPIFTVMDLSIVVARAQVPESDIGSIRIGQSCRFSAADIGGAKFEGSIRVVNRAVDPARQTVEVWGEIANANRGLRAGTFGTLITLTASLLKSVVVPVTSVQFTEGTRNGSVMVVDDKHIAHKREIEGGELADGFLEVRKGLSPGETVVVEAGYGLPEGTEVRWVEGKKP